MGFYTGFRLGMGFATRAGACVGSQASEARRDQGSAFGVQRSALKSGFSLPVKNPDSVKKPDKEKSL